MENQPKSNTSREVIAYLAKCFPQCFSVEGEAKPLKIGIFKDLVARLPDEEQVSKTQLRSALRLYTSSWRYLYGVKEGAKRIDLDGRECEELEVQHIEHARKQLEEAKARRAKKEQRPEKTPSDVSSTGEKRGKSRPFVKRKPHEADTSVKAVRKESRKSDSVQRKVERETISASQSVDVANVSLSELNVGQHIRVKAGKDIVEATIVEIVKDGARVQLSSGLTMIVRAEHLRF